MNYFAEGSVDREEISWWLNMVLNFKSQKEITQDIADGVFQMAEIENIFPREYVQELRRGNCESTKNYLYRFKHMTGERMKDVLCSLLGQNKYNNLVNEIKDCYLSLGNSNLIDGVKHLIRITKNTNFQSTLNTMSTVPGELELCNALGTKKKRVAKKNVNVNSNKKNEKPKIVKETAKKIKSVKLTKNKLGANVDNGNNIKEMIPSKENQMDNENISNDFIYSSSSQTEKSKESSFDDQEKNEDRSIEAGSIVVQNSLQKDTKIGTKKKPRPKKSNVPIKSSSPIIEDKMEESEKSKINENATNDEEKESNLTKSNDCCEDFLLETRNNSLLNLNKCVLDKLFVDEATNISNSKNGDKEICSNHNREIPEFQKYIQLDKSTSKQLNIDNNVIKVKTEFIDSDSCESNSNGLNHSINPNKENLSVKNLKRSSNSNKSRVPMNFKQSKNIPQKSALVKSTLTSNCKKKNKPDRKVTKYVTDNRKESLSRKKQNEREHEEMKIKLRLRVNKMQNNLEEFKYEMTKLFKDMKHVGADEEEFSDSFTDYSSEEISSTSSYTESSSEFSSEWSTDSSTEVYSSGSSEECSCCCSECDSF